MSNATQSVAAARINSLLDANSFVEIGQAVTARATDFNMTEKKALTSSIYRYSRRSGEFSVELK